MTQDQWRELRESFEQAKALTPAVQEELVARLRERDPLLATELGSMFAAQAAGTAFLEGPAVDPSLLKLVISQHSGTIEPACPQPGSLIEGRYEIDGMLGEGGFGRVYSARDRRLEGRKVVVKVLKLPPGEALEKRFQQEIRALSLLDHPCIVGVTDSGRLADGSAFLVMQYVEGRSLQELIVEGSLAPERSTRLLRDMADALSVAHQAGVLHRDLKPTNVIVRNAGHPGERAVLIDFGIARTGAMDAAERQTTMVVGSPQYMSPEQLLGRASPASDVYSLGAVAFEMYSGRSLLQTTRGERPEAAAGNALRSVVPALPPGLVKVIAESVAIDPRKRTASAAEFARALSVSRGPRVRMRWLAAGAFCIASLAGYAWIQSSAVPRKAIAPSPPAKQLHVGLNRRSKVDGAPPQPVRAGDLLRNGDQLEIEIQAPEPGFIYAFDESQVPGVDTPRFTLLFPGAGRQPAEARTSQRIPESQSAWLEFDGTTLQESLWLVWSRNPVGQLEPFREYSRPPSYGALPEGDARGLSLWLEQHTANPPLLEQEMNGFRWRQTSDPLIGHIALPVGTK